MREKNHHARKDFSIREKLPVADSCDREDRITATVSSHDPAALPSHHVPDAQSPISWTSDHPQVHKLQAQHLPAKNYYNALGWIKGNTETINKYNGILLSFEQFRRYMFCEKTMICQIQTIGTFREAFISTINCVSLCKRCTFKKINIS